MIAPHSCAVLSQFKLWKQVGEHNATIVLDGSWDLSGVYDSDTHTLFLDLTPPEGGGFGYGRDVHLVLRSGS